MRACRGAVKAVGWLAGSWVHRLVNWMAYVWLEEMLALHLRALEARMGLAVMNAAKIPVS